MAGGGASVIYADTVSYYYYIIAQYLCTKGIVLLEFATPGNVFKG